MNIYLSPELEQLVQTKVQTGGYTSPSEVVGEALRLMAQRDEARTIRLQDLRGRIDLSLSQADRGEGVDGEVFMQELIDDLDAREAGLKVG